MFSINSTTAYIPGSSDLHLGDHLCGEEDGDDGVKGKSDVDELVAHLECLRGVHAHGDHADECANAQQATHLVSNKMKYIS